MSDRQCETCQYWHGPWKVRGYCRRHAPVPVIGGADEVESVWPETDPWEWCGEWRDVSERPNWYKRSVGNGSAGNGVLHRIEREALLWSLQRHEGDKTKVAEEVGCSVKTVYNRMTAYGLWTPKKHKAAEVKNETS